MATTEGPPLTVMIPLGGLGSRFANEGYNMRTKPFVRVLGKEMILWLTDNLCLRDDDTLVIVYNPEFSNIKVCMEVLLKPKLWDRIRFVELNGPTRGAAETVLLGVQGLPKNLQERPILLCDGDTFYTTDVVNQYRDVAKHGRNAVFCFQDDQEKPIYSYITVPDLSTMVITDIKEKVKISDLANSGCYCFASGTSLAKYCEYVISQALTQQSQNGVGEFYTSGVIKAMLDEGGNHVFQAIKLSKSDMHVLGTPQQVQEFCRDWPSQPQLRFIFDLDNTLCTSPRITGDYSTCEPIQHTIDYLRDIKAQGHTVVIATARRMRTHKHNVAAVVADVGPLTIKWLEDHEVPYDELFFGKPWGHFYIDDLAVCPVQGSDPLALAKQTGFYKTHVKVFANDGGSGPGVTVKPDIQQPRSVTRQVTPQVSKDRSSEHYDSGFFAGVFLGIALTATIGLIHAKTLQRVPMKMKENRKSKALGVCVVVAVIVAVL